MRIFVEDDPSQTARVRTVLESLSAKNPGYISQIVLLELSWILSSRYKYDRDAVAHAVDLLLCTTGIRMEGPVAVRMTLNAFQGGAKVGFEDCMIAQNSAAAGCEYILTLIERLPNTQACGCFDAARKRHASATVHPNQEQAMRQEIDVKLTGRGPKGAWTHILIPFNAEEVFGRRGLIPVAGTINGYAFRSSLMPEGKGRFYLAANKIMLAGAGAAAGDTVHLVLELDTAERTVEVPPELSAALEPNPAAAAAFAALAYSHQKEYVDWITGAKKQETREARAQKAAAMITEGKRRS